MNNKCYIGDLLEIISIENKLYTDIYINNSTLFGKTQDGFIYTVKLHEKHKKVLNQ
jgi:hypothetical protein